MAAPTYPKTKVVASEDLLPGDKVMNSQLLNIGLPPNGLVVKSARYNKETGYVDILWEGATKTEQWNPYDNWYVLINPISKEKTNG